MAKRVRQHDRRMGGEIHADGAASRPGRTREPGHAQRTSGPGASSTPTSKPSLNPARVKLMKKSADSRNIAPVRCGSALHNHRGDLLLKDFARIHLQGGQCPPAPSAKTRQADLCARERDRATVAPRRDATKPAPVVPEKGVAAKPETKGKYSVSTIGTASTFIKR